MAYPFVPSLPFGEFRGKLISEYACRWDVLPISYSPRRLGVLERDVSGQTLDYVTDMEDADRVLPSTLRSICARLKIDPADFGLVLG